MADVEALRELLRRLRDPDAGCPWDREQTFATIAPYTIEEAYEVDDAIRREAWDELREELGDLQLQVLYHAQLAEERGYFALEDVLAALRDKLVRRHPHVFAEPGARLNGQQVAEHWEEHKAQERAQRGDTSALDDVPVALPALLRMAKLTRRALRAGLWPAHPEARPEARSGAEVRLAPLACAEQELLEQIERTVGPLDAQGLSRLLGVCARAAASRGEDPEGLLRDEIARFEGALRAAERQAREAAWQPGRAAAEAPASGVESHRERTDEAGEG